VEVRRATEADLEEEFGVFKAAMAELRGRRGAPWTPRPWDPTGPWAGVHRHLLAYDGDRAVVAEEGGRVVGFAAAWVRDGHWFLSALFVHPGHQSRGVGRRLLDAVWDGSHPRRATVAEAIQPVSTGLYARRGLIPLTPVLDMSGIAQATAPEDLQPGDADPAALCALDEAAYGFDRAIDHAFWRRTRRATLWTRAGQPAAYSYAGGGDIGPVAGRSPADAARALRAELARSAGSEVGVSVPGSATQLVEVALAAGLRMDDPGLLLMFPGGRPPPDALALHSYWLM
jgi:GNAT superfamily N-acetyltransferase